MNTPWGKSDSSHKYARGIIFYGTSSHGGIHVCKTMNKKMPDYLINESGWYEEDCEWSKVAVFFPSVFPQTEYDAACKTLKNWLPEVYEKFLGIIVMPGESMKRDEDIFKMETRSKMVCISASRDWKEGVPSGHVEVFAGRGGRLENGQYPNETATYYVPSSEYDSRHRTYVVDESKYARI